MTTRVTTTKQQSSSWISGGEVLKLRTSLLKSYLRCPAACFFRYFKGLIIIPRSWLTFGSCTHSAAEHANRYKRDKGKEAKVSVLQDIFHDEWRKRKRNTKFTEDENPNDIENEGIKKIIPLYHERLYKRVEPLYVEEPFQIEILEEKLIITGTIDLVETDHLIRDLKTKGKPPQWDEARKSFQGKSYRAGYKEKFKKDPEGFLLDCIVRKREPELITTKIVSPSASDYLEFRQTSIQIAQCIRKGIFFPKREGNYFCSKHSCGYWDICNKGEWRKLGVYTQVYGANYHGGKK